MFQQGKSGKGLGGSGTGTNFGSVLGTFYEKAGFASLANERVREKASFLHKSA